MFSLRLSYLIKRPRSFNNVCPWSHKQQPKVTLDIFFSLILKWDVYCILCKKYILHLEPHSVLTFSIHVQFNIFKEIYRSFSPRTYFIMLIMYSHMHICILIHIWLLQQATKLNLILQHWYFASLTRTPGVAEQDEIAICRAFLAILSKHTQLKSVGADWGRGRRADVDRRFQRVPLLRVNIGIPAGLGRALGEGYRHYCVQVTWWENWGMKWETQAKALNCGLDHLYTKASMQYILRKVPSMTFTLRVLILGLKGRPSSWTLTLNGAPLRTTRDLVFLKPFVLWLSRFSDCSRSTYFILKSASWEKKH